MPRVKHDLTRAQRNNLKKLATYLESLPEDYEHFEMDIFISQPDVCGSDEPEFAKYARENGGVAQHGCGTVACAVGHGPAAGVLFRPSDMGNAIRWIHDKGYVSFKVPVWDRYSNRFCNEDTALWSWLFGGQWSDFDNHHWGAAARIRYVLAGKPLPEHWGSRFSEIQDGDVELYADFRVSEPVPLEKEAA